MYHKRTKNDNKFIRPFMEKKTLAMQQVLSTLEVYMMFLIDNYTQYMLS